MPFSATAIATNTSTSGATVAVTVPAAGVPPGSLILVAVTEKSTGGVNGSLADTAGNTWNTSQAANLAALAADGRGMVFFAFASKALVSGNTITYTKATSGTIAAISAWYYGGVRTDANPEVTATRASATGTTGTITVTSAAGSQGSVFVGVLLDSSSSAAGGAATFTQAASWSPSGGFEAISGTGSGNARVDAGYLVASGSGTQTYAPTLSSTAQQWALLITAFTLVPNVQQRLGVTGHYSDYVPDTIWVGKPIQNMTINTPQALSPAQAPLYAPRPHTDTDYWQATSTSDNTLRLLTEGGQPPQKVWHYDADFNTYWVGAPQAKPIFLAGQVPTKFWRYDTDLSTAWQFAYGRNNAGLLSTTQITPGATEEYYPDYSSYVWQYTYQTNAQLLATTTNTVQSPLYAPRPPDHIGWQFQFPRNDNTLPPTGAHNPFIPPPLGAEQYFVEQPGWEFSSQPQPLAFTLLQLYAPLPPEAYYYDNSADVWRFTIQQNNLLNPPALLAPIQSPFYAPRPGPDQVWQWAPPYTLTNESAAQTSPVISKFWRYDYQVEFPQWQGTPLSGFFSQNIPSTNNVNDRWRYDYNSSDVGWVWTAPPSGTLRGLTQATPFSKTWRYDWNTEYPQWQGSPLNAKSLINVAPVNPKNKQIWRYDYSSGQTHWVGSPVATNIETIPAVKLPTSLADNNLDHVQDYVPPTSWNWSQVYNRNLEILPVGQPLGFGKRKPLFLQGLNKFPASYWPDGNPTTTAQTTSQTVGTDIVSDDGSFTITDDGRSYMIVSDDTHSIIIVIG